MSAVKIFMWMSPDSARVLGLGQTAESAYRDAEKRHDDADGWGMLVTFEHFPPETNPLVAIARAVRAQYPPTKSITEDSTTKKIKSARVRAVNEDRMKDETSSGDDSR